MLLLNLISVQDWKSREIEGKCNQVLLPNKNIHLSLVAFCISKNVLSSFAYFFLLKHQWTVIEQHFSCMNSFFAFPLETISHGMNCVCVFLLLFQNKC